jgi:hypothetical protein
MVGDFMWMGPVDLVDGRRLHLYKHTDTRSYLRLDPTFDQLSIINTFVGGKSVVP